MFINCIENCIHQANGLCTLEHIGHLSNTSPVGCEFYVEKDCGKKKEEGNNS